MEILRQAAIHVGSAAVRLNGLTASYGATFHLADNLRGTLTSQLPQHRIGKDGPRVGIYAEPGLPYVASTWATWSAGAVSVPLATSHPPPELAYVLEDAGVSVVLVPEELADKVKDTVQKASAKMILVPANDVQRAHTSSSSSSSIPYLGDASEVEESRGALIIYTSGTTGRPKGALHTHGSIAAQVQCLTKAWEWQASDSILHALPLHHTHGIVNALFCAHHSGACVEFVQKFSPGRVWDRLMSGDVSVFMGVPTMYIYLLNHYRDNFTPKQQEVAQAAARSLRLTVSGSAACPGVVMERWRQLSGQDLLERYGMTETGMILSNPYKGERRQGFVGVPLPGLKVKVRPLSGEDSDASGDEHTSSSSSSRGSSSGSSSLRDGGPAACTTGELLVCGRSLFREYWERPEATAEAFDEEGYFKTGDVVEIGGEPPYYRILGRASVDMIKSGGYKISALDIENVLLQHPVVSEAAVLGQEHEELGQIVTALVVVNQQQPAQEGGGHIENEAQNELKAWCEQHLPTYQVPRRWLLLGEPLPRNAMGKVNKKQLLECFCS